MINILITFLFLSLSSSLFAYIPKNFGTVILGVYRGGILTQESEYAYLSDLGVNTIINLEYFHKEKKEYCEEFNLDCQKHSILQLPFQNINTVQFKKAYKSTVSALIAGKIIYIHCYRGSDRTGALASALIIRERACDKEYDPNLLIEIKRTLNKYNFSKFLFPQLYFRILSWVKEPPHWLCD